LTCAIVLGTRPEIVKLAPVVWAFQRHGLPLVIVHTGQHYSHEMDRAFFRALDLPEPDYHLVAGEAGASHGVQTGTMLQRLEPVVVEQRVDRLIVHGDTNSTLAGALVGAKLNLPVGHVEAGLRSYDRTMPEEVNRVIVDHIATSLYAPTAVAAGNLAREGLTKGVSVTGNTFVDTLYRLRPRLAAAAKLAEVGVARGAYAYVTLHRQENVDHPGRLALILSGLDMVARATGLRLALSLHYRTKDRLERFGLSGRLASIPGLIALHPPVGLVESLELQAHAALVLTDSGGLQEEACVLGTPCVTIRENTERPETLAIGANILAGYHPETILAAARRMLAAPRGWPNPFGDGLAGARCLADIMQRPDLDPGPLPAGAASTFPEEA
jgi:UDP-N-acetylglucosamine 2-epimerase (non-hydrolysing)